MSQKEKFARIYLYHHHSIIPKINIEMKYGEISLLIAHRMPKRERLDKEIRSILIHKRYYGLISAENEEEVEVSERD